MKVLRRWVAMLAREGERNGGTEGTIDSDADREEEKEIDRVWNIGI